MTTDRRPMAELAARWSELLIAELPANESLTVVARATGSLLREPATEADIAAAEQRLGRALPPSYREFLLVSNGAFGDDYGPTLVDDRLDPEAPSPESAVVGVGFLPVQDIVWLRDADPDYARLLADLTDLGPYAPVSGDGVEPPGWTPFADGLVIATDKAPGATVLIPFGDEPDWQLWNIHQETATGYLSFGSFLASAVREREPLHLSLVDVAWLIDGPAEQWWTRVQRLRLVETPKAVPLLIAALHRGENQPRIREHRNIARAAGTALGRIGTHEAVAALLAAELDLAVDGLKIARTPAALDAIAATGDYLTLEELGDPRAARMAAAALSTPDAIGPQVAAGVVGRSRNSAYTPDLAAAYMRANTDSERLAFACALSDLGSSLGETYLDRLAQSDSRWATRARWELDRFSRRRQPIRRGR
jgi:SMI1 / KNR4 family (SUKH-1)